MLFNPKNQISKPLRCPDCGADMDYLASQLNGRVFLSTLLERNFFVCSDCGRLSHELVARHLFVSDAGRTGPSVLHGQ
jgi:hypothetical protein